MSTVLSILDVQWVQVGIREARKASNRRNPLDKLGIRAGKWAVKTSERKAVKKGTYGENAHEQ